MIDLDAALSAPARVFRNLSDLFEAATLTRDQKVQALRQWHYDLRELQVATDKNMRPTGDAGDRLGQVEAALSRLDVDEAFAGPRTPAAGLFEREGLRPRKPGLGRAASGAAMALAGRLHRHDLDDPP
jgi:hypothetical protein